MGMKHITYLLALLLACPVLGAEAVIEAPDSANIGDLVVLNSSKSEGDNQLWVIDERLTGRFLEIEDKIIFATGTAGIYDFQLIVADTTAAISQAKHKVAVGTPTPPTPPPTPPTPPTPDLQKAVESATRAVNDPQTAKALLQALISLPEKTPETVQAAIAEVLLNRGPESQTKDWLKQWRTPVNEAIEKSNLPYPQAIEQVIAGLEQTASIKVKSTITVYTRDNCPPCAKWMAEEYTKFKNSGWAVEVVKDNNRPGPSFVICHKGVCREIIGFLPFSAFVTIAKEMDRE